MTPTQSEWDLENLPALPPIATGLPDDVEVLIRYLMHHCRGPDNIRAASRIACDLGIGPADGRKVRNLIALYHDRFPVVVCGQPGHGYFVTADPAHMTHYERSLHAIIAAVAARIGKFRSNATRLGYLRTGSGPTATYHSPPESRLPSASASA